MWERTLQDLIRGLRANKTDERKFIQQAIEEIRKEVRGKDMELKAGAILKMTFLDMLGHDLTWANFNIIEVMSSQKYHLKTIGYLAASQSFSEHTDVLMLTTNLLKKDLSSNPADVALALNGLSHFVTSDLARDLTQELNAMLNHSRSYIRKRVVLALFKVIQQHPDALPYCLPRLKEKLEDPDLSVVSSTVNLFCELSRRNPQDFLILAPPLFHILTTSSNNWMLIKVIKLFGAISPFEPRLVKKLQGPITDLIQTTSAISLLYECVHTCIVGGMLEGSSGLPLARLCVTKLSGFLENDDQNLKFIAMMAMVKIVPIRPELVAEHQAVILNSLDDFDISIRMRALELICSMVTPHNAQFLVQQLLSHLVKASEKSESLPSASETLSRSLQGSSGATTVYTTAYRTEVATRVIDMCSKNMYENVQDFDWYLSVLLDLIYVANADIASIVREQLIDIVVRVKACRPYAVRLMTKLLDDDALVLGADDPTKCTGVLWAAAWICGEYCDELADPRYTLLRLVLPSIALLPADIISVYLQAAVKVLSRWLIGLSEQWSDDQLPQVKSIVGTALEGLQRFASHADVEVQERAANATEMLTLIRADLEKYRPRPPTDSFDVVNEFAAMSATSNSEPRFPKSFILLRRFFVSYTLRPVASDAQNQIGVPEGLNLDAWIVPPPKGVGNDERAESGKKKKKKSSKLKEKDNGDLNGHAKGKRKEQPLKTSWVEYDEDEVEAAAKREERLARQRDDPYYLTDGRPKPSQSSSAHDIETIPVVRLDDMPSLSSVTAPRETPSRLSDIVPPSPKRFELDVEGEAPVNQPASSSVSGVQTPQSGTDALGNDGLLTPEAIVVKRTKKKTSGKKKTVVTSL